MKGCSVGLLENLSQKEEITRIKEIQLRCIGMLVWTLLYSHFHLATELFGKMNPFVYGDSEFISAELYLSA